MQIGHWVAEVQRYFPDGPLTAVAFSGATGRTPARNSLTVASYDNIRTNVDWFAQQEFLYCVLDEGHMIRNPRTKVSKACKRVCILVCALVSLHWAW